MTDHNAFKPVEAADMAFSFPVAYGHYQDTFNALRATELKVTMLTADRDTLSHDLDEAKAHHQYLLEKSQKFAHEINHIRHVIREYFQNLLNEMDDPENDEFEGLDIHTINILFDSLNILPLEPPMKLFRVDFEPADVRVSVDIYAKNEDEAEEIASRLSWTIEPYGSDFEDCDAEIDFNVYSVNRVDLS